MSIDEHRAGIDRIDADIVRLLNERTRHVLAIGEIKKAEGKEIYAPHREKLLLDRLASINPGPVPNDSLKAIYREIMSCSLSLEKSMLIAYLGPEATFTHLAALKRFGASLKYSSQKTIGDVFGEVSKGRADYGVVPVENSTEGVVSNTLDMFVDSDLKIVAQILLKIEHCLVGTGEMAEVERLYSHPQAFGQCRRWVVNHFPKAETVETSSTTRAAEMASREPKAGAIASSLAAEHYGLRVLESGIQDNPDNVTRFLVLGRQCSPPTGKDLTSLMFSVPDEVGSLHRALDAFRQNHINMKKIESRPNKRKAWEYFFFVNCLGHQEDEQVARTLNLLRNQCSFVKVLGSYPDSSD